MRQWNHGSISTVVPHLKKRISSIEVSTILFYRMNVYSLVNMIFQVSKLCHVENQPGELTTQENSHNKQQNQRKACLIRYFFPDIDFDKFTFSLDYYTFLSVLSKLLVMLVAYLKFSFLLLLNPSFGEMKTCLFH